MRFIVGGGALVAGVLAPVRLPLRLSLLAFAVSELLTAGAGYCPLNKALGINTAREVVKAGLASTAKSVLQ